VDPSDLLYLENLLIDFNKAFPNIYLGNLPQSSQLPPDSAFPFTRIPLIHNLIRHIHQILDLIKTFAPSNTVACEKLKQQVKTVLLELSKPCFGVLRWAGTRNSV